ncbi:MAG: hypothetical protein LUD51_02190 [Clostridia bacterium]|nr:hypothetical protein [Clostridia bacterium]
MYTILVDGVKYIKDTFENIQECFLKQQKYLIANCYSMGDFGFTTLLWICYNLKTKIQAPHEEEVRGEGGLR